MFKYLNDLGFDFVPYRVLVANELADLLGVLAHPNRIRIIEELRDGERNVN